VSRRTRRNDRHRFTAEALAAGRGGQISPADRIQAIDIVCGPCRFSGRGERRLARFLRYTDPEQRAHDIEQSGDGVLVEAWGRHPTRMTDGPMRVVEYESFVPEWTTDPTTGVDKVHLVCGSCGHHKQITRPRILSAPRCRADGPRGPRRVFRPALTL
jgi:hypothetical protein